MAGYNRIIMVGNLTRDPDYKQLPSGQGVCQFGLASNRQYKNKQTGTLVQEVCFIDIDVFGPQADTCKQYLQKGRPVLIEGRLKFDSWESPEGQKRSKHGIIADRVVFLASASDSDSFEKAEESSSATAEIRPAASASTKTNNTTKKKSASVFQDDLAIPNNGELALGDEPPFQDDLPF